MNKTSIEWTHRPETRGAAGGMTWNPIRARLKGASPKARSGTFCTRISPGCAHCYASTINKRFGNGLEFTVPNLEKIEFFVDERILDEPRRQRNPCTIFVGDMFDLFHEAIPTDLIVQVFRAMCVSDLRHTFQILTKRTARMKEFFLGWNSHTRDFGSLWPYTWPRPNIWLGTSVEDEKRRDERVPRLLETPAVIRFLSVEPQLEAIDFEPESIDGMPTVNMLRGADWCDPPVPGIDWVICGGESGPGARPFNISWAESLLAECEAAHVPFFMKQLGSKPERDGGRYIGNFDGYQRHEVSGKGGQMHEWPPSLRVREFPAARDREAVTA
jgi:protein gp37